MPLVIIESPNKIQKLKKILGSKYTIMATVGHIMDLPKKELGIDTKTFEATYKINADKKDIVNRIKEEAKNHEDIYLATDPDREGEKISYDIQGNLNKKGHKFHRVKFNSITKDAVEKAFKNSEDVDIKLCDSQQARRLTDRLVGFKVSSIMWGKGLRGTSAGRVQSVALKYVVDREKEIRAFKPEEYWEIFIDTDHKFQAEFFGIDGDKAELKNQAETDVIVNDIKKSKKDLIVSEYKQQNRLRSPAPPFETSTLQQAASSLFGWKAEKAMDVAQQLFAGGRISYHRTDSVNIDPEKVKELRERILQNHGQKYLSPDIRFYKSKEGSQGAHEGIRPTYENSPAPMSTDEQKLLKLIDDRFTASQMADAVFDQVNIKLDYPGKNTYNFKANGSVMQFDGFLKVYGENKEDVLLPALKPKQKISWNTVTPTQHFTQAPGRYSDASLIKRLKEDGVGRPSTYASIIKTLDERKYIERANKALKATEVGIMVSDYLDKFFPELTNSQFTATMENNLDEIAIGNKEFLSVMSDFYSKLSASLEFAKKNGSTDLFKTDISCKLCDGKMIKKVSEHGVFFGCEKYPACGFVLNHDENGNIVEDKVETSVPCPTCGSKISKKKSKTGSQFYGCSTYPSCTWTGNIDENGNIVAKKNIAEQTNISCDKCKTGKMLKRVGAKGPWLGCDQYPKCKNTMGIDDAGTPFTYSKAKKVKSTAKDTGVQCPKCQKGNLVERKGAYGLFKGCGNFPKCKYIEK